MVLALRGDRPPRVALVVDHPQRDLEGLVLVAHLLAARGTEVIILPFYAQNFDLAWIDADVLVLNYVRPANARVVENANKCGVALAILDTEGGLLPEDGPTSPAGIASFLSSTGLDKRLSLYMFWGSQLRQEVVARTALQESQAIVTGCPRFDLARDPWTKSSQVHDRILVNTNFPTVNSAFASDGEEDRAALRSVGFTEARIDEIIADNRAVMSQMVSAIGQIARARPRLQFLVRPHPFESDAPYLSAFSGIENITVDRSGNVLDQIARSSCLLHVNCTTAIEATMSQVPAISLNFANRDSMRRMAALPSQVSIGASSIDEALELIDQGRAALRDEAWRAAMAHIEPFFGPSDGRAAERVTSALSQLCENVSAAANGKPTQCRATIRDWGLALLGSQLIEGIRSRVYPSRVGKRIAMDQLQEALNRFAAAQGCSAAEVKRARTPLGSPMISFEISSPSIAS